ncbi:MAG: hypothetical protein AB7U83_03280 [Vicinamibacterales bacterium]
MTARHLLSAAAAAALLAVAPAHAQESSATDRQDAAQAATPRAASRGRAERSGGETRVRNPRRADSAPTTTQEAQPRRRVAAAPAAAPAAPTASAEEQGGRRRPGGAVRGGGGSSGGQARPRPGGVRRPDAGGDRGLDGRGRAQAVPRRSAPRPPRTVYLAPNYGRRFYYGPTGLGYWAYDPWSWYGYGGWGGWGGWGGYYGNWGGYYGNWNGGYGGYGYGAYAGPSGWSIGSVRLKVEPKDAEVYVDGYYAGIVDDFDGIWQRLRLDDGGHRIEVRKPGLPPLIFDVMVQPGRTITYRGDLRQP